MSRKNKADITPLIATEAVQESAKVDAIAANLLPLDEIALDEMPAIIADEDGKVIDGHHRLAALRKVGATVWPVTTVSRAAYDAIAGERGHDAACRELVDEAGDYVTFGIYA